MNQKRLKVTCILLAVCLVASICLSVFLLLYDNSSYLQTPDQIYVMEAGILRSYQRFDGGEDIAISYDFDNPAYESLLAEYNIEKIAGEGTELQKVLRLMHEFSPRLTHQSNFTADIEMSALPLLRYSLNNRSQGINCRCKAQILNEMCLSLGIYSRKVWLMPLSEYDDDCHVVNEIWDTSLGKWVMLDITNDQYWVDESGTPLSVMEIRERGALREFCTPATPSDALSDPQGLRQRYMNEYLHNEEHGIHEVSERIHGGRERAGLYAVSRRHANR